MVNGHLIKTGLKEKTHLLWSLGGVPALDAEMWNTHSPQVKTIQIHTDKRLFTVDANTFNLNKESVDYGYGKQYVLPKQYWNIINKSSRTNL